MTPVTFELVISGHRHVLPPGAQVITVPRLKLALVAVGAQVVAVNSRGVISAYSVRDLRRLWSEWRTKWHD